MASNNFINLFSDTDSETTSELSQAYDTQGPFVQVNENDIAEIHDDHAQWVQALENPAIAVNLLAAFDAETVILNIAVDLNTIFDGTHYFIPADTPVESLGEFSELTDVMNEFRRLSISPAPKVPSWALRATTFFGAKAKPQYKSSIIGLIKSYQMYHTFDYLNEMRLDFMYSFIEAQQKAFFPSRLHNEIMTDGHIYMNTLLMRARTMYQRVERDRRHIEHYTSSIVALGWTVVSWQMLKEMMERQCKAVSTLKVVQDINLFSIITSYLPMSRISPFYEFTK